MMKIAVQRRELAKNALWAALLALGIVIYFYRVNGFLMIGDALFLSGMLFCIIGLFRLTRHWELYHSTIYGFKRLWRGLRQGKHDANVEQEEHLGSYSDFLAENPYERPYLELIIVGALLIVISILF